MDLNGARWVHEMDWRREREGEMLQLYYNLKNKGQPLASKDLLALNKVIYYLFVFLSCFVLFLSDLSPSGRERVGKGEIFSEGNRKEKKLFLGFHHS